MFVGDKCNNCQKESKTWYVIRIVSVKSPADWISEVNKYEEKQFNGKLLCLDCWKKEEKGFRELAWDTFNWRCERDKDKRKKMDQLVFISKFSPKHVNGEEVSRRSCPVWNQPSKRWTFAFNLVNDLSWVSEFNDQLPELSEEIDEGLYNNTSNSSNNSNPVLWIILAAVFLIGAAMLFCLLTKKKKKKKA